jgi:hypothetical protein
LIENGLYRALLPKRFGGTRRRWKPHADAGGGGEGQLDRLVPRAMRRLRDDGGYLEPTPPTDLLNRPAFWPGGVTYEVKAVPGGYLASARWDFASARGGRLAGGPCGWSRKTARAQAGRLGEIRTILFPATSATCTTSGT